MLSKKLVISFVVILLMLSGPRLVLASGGKNPSVLPPSAEPQGLTQSEWSAELFKFLYATPASENPITGSTGNHCVVKMVGNFALVLTNPASSEPYSCSVPSGTMLVTPVGGGFCDTLSWPWPQGETGLRDCVSTLLTTSDVQASIDGVEIENLAEHLVQSPLFSFTLPEGNIYGYPAGTTGQAMVQIHLLIVTPLPIGEHTLHFHSTYPALGNYTEDFTLQITVKR